MISAKKLMLFIETKLKNTTIHQNFIEIEWPVDFRKDP